MPREEVLLFSLKKLSIARSTIASNLATGGAGDSGGLFSNKSGAVLTILKTTFIGNESLDRGEGIHILGVNTELSIITSKFSGNKATGACMGTGEGLSLGSTGFITLSKNLVHQDIALDGNGGGLLLREAVLKTFPGILFEGIRVI